MVTEEDPLHVLGGCLLRVKIKLPDASTREVKSNPPRPSWRQQLRALIER